MSLLALEKHHFHAIVQFLATEEQVSQSEITSLSLMKTIFSYAQATNAVKCLLFLFNFPVSLSHNTAQHN